MAVWKCMPAQLQFCKACLLAVLFLKCFWHPHQVGAKNLTPLPPIPTLPNSKDFLDPHNAARSQVNVSPLRWNITLAAYALAHGQKQRDYNNCDMEHSNGTAFGENLFWGSNLGFSAAYAVNSWISEQEFYNYDQNSCVPDEVCGYYTHVVWRNSTQVGCAAVHCYDTPF